MQELILDTIANDDPNLRIIALEAMALYNEDEAIQLLLQLHKNDTSPDVRWYSALELIKSRNELTLPILVPLLEDNNWTVTERIDRLAISKLYENISYELNEPMQKLLKSDDSVMRQYAAAILYEIGDKYREMGLIELQKAFDNGEYVISIARQILRRNGIDVGYV